MSWAKVDDQFHTSEKALDCSLAARGLWLMCLSWVGDKETDGAVPRSVVRLHGAAEWEQLSGELVSAGLWEKTEGGFQFHDYLDYNRSKAELEEERVKAAERKAVWKQKHARTSAAGTATERRSPSVPNSDGTKHPEPVPVPDTRMSPSENIQRLAVSTAQEPPQEPQAAAKEAPPRADYGVEVENLLLTADANPETAHWRDAVARAVSAPGVHHPHAYALKLLRSWRRGENCPPIPCKEQPPPRRLTASQQRAKEIRDRNNADLERDLAEIDRWAEQQQAGAPVPPSLRIASGGMA